MCSLLKFSEYLNLKMSKIFLKLLIENLLLQGASRDEVCTNCESAHSTLWRKSTSTGETVCNACGLYERLHNVRN